MGEVQARTHWQHLTYLLLAIVDFSNQSITLAFVILARVFVTVSLTHTFGFKRSQAFPVENYPPK